MSVEKHVQARYAEGAQERQQELCCPVNYQTELLEILPTEIIEKDYGCGDPSRYVREGDTVLDLGSGGGKICYMAAQIVGESGHVHGVDMTDDMLALARKHQRHMADKIGQDRVTFHKGYIQNLAFDLDEASRYVASHPIESPAQLAEYEGWKRRQQREAPMIGNNTISLVISNCVLNLVDRQDRQQMIEEIFRVLAPGGRVAISDIISDRVVPEALQQDPKLWSGCISGAFEEKEFIDAFVRAGFVGVAYDQWDLDPWQVVEDIEFRSATLIASKPITDSASTHALMYLGPHSSVTDDFGNVLTRGTRTPVSKAAYRAISESPDADQFVGFERDNCGGPDSDEQMPNTAGQMKVINDGKAEKKGGCC